MLFFGLSILSWGMSSKKQFYHGTRKYGNPVRRLYSSGLLQAEGIIGLLLSARRGRARDSPVLSLPTRTESIFKKDSENYLFLITNSPEAANGLGKGIFSYLEVTCKMLEEGILNNIWSVGLFPMYFRMNTPCPSF